MMKNVLNHAKISWLACFTFITTATQAQNTIVGIFPALAGQQVRLVGFEGMGIYPIDSTKVSEKGDFKLNFTSKDRGMGYLSAADNKASFVVLDNEDIQLKGEVFSIPESIVCLSGKENQLFVRYATEHPKREQALSAWEYLQKLYIKDSLYYNQKRTQKAIDLEIHRIHKENSDFLKSLDTKSYISWFLPTRILVSSVATITQYRPEEIPAAIAAFRNLDYSDNRLYKSGLLKNTIESHFWLLENSGKSLDSVFVEMQLSIDAMMVNLIKDEKKHNEVTNYLFDLLERHSLFQASEYLAIKVLNETSCTINSELANQLETYRAMKKGNIAPEINFGGMTYLNGLKQHQFRNLSDIKSLYTLVVFGASWCPKCTEELPKVIQNYPKWRDLGVEVVYISLDTDQSAFDQSVKTYPFIAYCDYKKWESQVTKDYYVFGTPTFFLLNNKREIVLRPNSIAQIDAWVDWVLVQGNK